MALEENVGFFFHVPTGSPDDGRPDDDDLEGRRGRQGHPDPLRIDLALLLLHLGPVVLPTRELRHADATWASQPRLHTSTSVRQLRILEPPCIRAAGELRQRKRGKTPTLPFRGSCRQPVEERHIVHHWNINFSRKIRLNLPSFLLA